MNRVRLPPLLLASGLATAFVLSAPSALAQPIARPRPVAAAALNPSTFAIQPLPPDAVALRARLSPKLNSSVRAWVTSEAKAIARQNLRPDAMLFMARSDAAARFAGQNIGAADIEALVTMVLMAAASDAENDLRSLMAEVKAANKSKASARTGANSANAPQGSTDDLGELSQAQQLQLQAFMDRRAKLLETLSNIMKKNSATSASITQNLK